MIFFIFILVFFVIGIIRPFLYIRGQEEYLNDAIGIIYKAENKYCLIMTLKGNYYLELQGYEVGDIIKISGQPSVALFSHYENSFDFSNYLHHRYVEYKIERCSATSIFKNIIRINSFKNYVLAYLDDNSKVLGASIIFGDSLSSLSSFKGLQNLGLTRLLSVSGFHISYIFHILSQKYQGKKYYRRLKLCELLFALTFLILTGFKFAFLRISIDMGLKLILHRKKIFLNRGNYLSLLASIILLFNPYYLFEYGFIYTFIILFFMAIMPKIKCRFKILQTPITFIISYLILLPINAFNNYEINILGVFISLVFLPILISIFLISLILLVIPFFGMILKYPFNFILLCVDKVTTLNLTFVTGKPSIIYIVFIYLLVILTIYFYEKKLLKIKNFLLTLSCLSLSVLFIPRFIYRDKIHFIDVGQGDSTLVQVNNKNYLFDTGGNIYVDLATNALIPYFKKNKIRKIDAVFITHRDYDHYGALSSLENNFKVGNIYYNYDVDELEFSGMKITNLNKYALGEEENYDSGVYYLTFSKKSLLIMGDAPTAIEKKIMSDNPNLKADYLKLGHHGSSTSSSYSFLKAVNPNVAIISCGYENRYKHPNSDVISNLESLNIKYYRTDLKGTMTFNI